MPDLSPIEPFLQRWAASGAAERANYQLFLSELCDVLGVERPQPSTPDERANGYVFEKPVPLPHGSTGRIDLYKRGCFVLEAKQGSGEWEQPRPLSTAATQARRARKRGTAVRGTATWDTAMERAREQAQAYARNLPPAELLDGGRPPFLIVVDVGATIELYSEFTRTGGQYIPFPDPQNYRIRLDELREEAARELLAAVWSEPMGLDPARRSARVTREIAAQLARLARSLEGRHAPDAVAHFLMRCLFTMFAEDVGLLPNRSFTQLLGDLRHKVQDFQPMVEHLWQVMNTGGFSVLLRTHIPRFNGDIFAEAGGGPMALPLDADQLGLLSEAAGADWRDVEPAIFGTLLERALDPLERHKLGAHYTPRAYVERLVLPTVIEPLRREWAGVKAAALLLHDGGQQELAVGVVEEFQRGLAHTRVLDPAAGTGNFLYVTLEHMKRIEGEVLQVLRELGQSQLSLEMEGVQVTPQQFLGIEVNPRAAAIAELVLWIGYLQWHYRTRGDVRPAEPIVRAFHNIENRDAVLEWERVEPLLDGDGRPVTRWDGRSVRAHPVTGELVPDEAGRVPVYRYVHPRPAAWPEADYVVGNPPFIGTARMREALGDGYAEAVRRVYGSVPDSADYVMFWWDKAAELARAGKVKRFGFITTNSLRQTFNRRVLEHHLGAEPPLSLRYAIPDHPWVDTAEGAAVRIAMTVGASGVEQGTLQRVVKEVDNGEETAFLEFETRTGMILPDLTIGAAVGETRPLRSNGGLSSRGMMLFGAGFIVTAQEAATLGLGADPLQSEVIKRYRNGRDITQSPRDVLVIDLFGLTAEEVRDRYPGVYQHVYNRVKPERDQNRDRQIRENWWLHGRSRPELRNAWAGLQRYIATVETSKHRFFVFLDQSILPDNKLIAIALDDAYYLGVLSSRIHVAWALATGSHLGVGNDPVYVKSACFEKFPFPDATPAQQARIRELGERLDGHRKRQQALHPKLALTDVYNVLAKVRGGEALDAKERLVHEQGLASVLAQLHEELDAAAAEAYGWPPDLPDAEILSRLVQLNRQRAAEEAQGPVRWLRPQYQAARAGLGQVQGALVREETAGEGEAGAAAAIPWPAGMAAQAAAVRGVLQAAGGPLTAGQVAGAFDGAERGRVEDLLLTLAALGQARGEGEGYVV